MFNFFKKKPEIKDVSSEAKIIFTLDDSKDVSINIEIPEYNSESMSRLASLISTISSNACEIQTIEMIKQTLLQDKEDELLYEFLLYVTTLSELKRQDGDKNNSKKPCISPSDMLK